MWPYSVEELDFLEGRRQAAPQDAAVGTPR